MIIILKYLLLLFFISTFSQGAIVGTIETLREVTNGSATTCGSPSFYSWYNYEDDQYARSNGTRAVRITWTGLSAATRYEERSRLTRVAAAGEATAHKQDEAARDTGPIVRSSAGVGND